MKHNPRPDAKRIVTGVDVTGQIPLLEYRRFGEAPPKWILWVAYNPRKDAGTYLVLSEDGSILRETTYPDGSVECSVITPAHYRRAGVRHVPKS